MKAGLEPMVRDAPPPSAVMRVVNPLMRIVLRTPMARLIRPLAVLTFEGHRTARRRQIVVGWHLLDGSSIVVTPATWRVNFAEARVATVWWRGQASSWVGTLEADPDSVAAALDQLLRSGTSDRALALRVPPGHAITSADVVETRRAIIRFRIDSGVAAY